MHQQSAMSHILFLHHLFQIILHFTDISLETSAIPTTIFSIYFSKITDVICRYVYPLEFQQRAYISRHKELAGSREAVIFRFNPDFITMHFKE